MNLHEAHGLLTGIQPTHRATIYSRTLNGSNLPPELRRRVELTLSNTDGHISVSRTLAWLIGYERYSEEFLAAAAAEDFVNALPDPFNIVGSTTEVMMPFLTYITGSGYPPERSAGISLLRLATQRPVTELAFAGWFEHTVHPARLLGQNELSRSVYSEWQTQHTDLSTSYMMCKAMHEAGYPIAALPHFLSEGFIDPAAIREAGRHGVPLDYAVHTNR